YTDSRGYCYLYIDAAMPSDEGAYEAVAENKHGSAHYTVHLYVADPPMFLEPLKDQRVRTHDTLHLECKVDGIPYPEVRFYKDWRLLTDSHRTRIRHVEPDVWHLTINGVIEKDTGLYTCTAKNIAGATLTSANVSIDDNLLNIPRPDLERPAIAFTKKRFDEDYDILERISHGPISSVYRVIERRTAKEYVAKIVHNPTYFDWLRREMDVLSKIYDSNVPRLHDAYESDKMLALVLDNVSGVDLLEHMLERKTYTERETALIIRNLVEILRNLHSRNIVHLDIKPDNIYIDDYYDPVNVRLLGFSNAKHLKGSSNFYSDYGSSEYVAPEIVTRSPVSLLTDMWNVGILSYLLLGGSTPFAGTNDFETNRMTTEQALNHPWLKYASQHVDTTPLSSDRLHAAYSRQLYDREHRRILTRPLQTISDLHHTRYDHDAYTSDRDRIQDDKHIRAGRKRTSRGIYECGS
ncbi:unnamed protein product, partial [Didymodactylos carnosus]